MLSLIFLMSSFRNPNVKLAHSLKDVAQNLGMPTHSKTTTYMASANTSGVQLFTEQLNTLRDNAKGRPYTHVGTLSTCLFHISLSRIGRHNRLGGRIAIPVCVWVIIGSQRGSGVSLIVMLSGIGLRCRQFHLTCSEGDWTK